MSEFLEDLDGGVFDRKLSIALSQVAAASIDNDKTGAELAGMVRNEFDNEIPVILGSYSRGN